MHPQPLRGEIWFVNLYTDPPGKGARPVVIASVDIRNQHPRVHTVLVIPLTSSVHRDIPTHVFLSAGETGLQSDSVARGENLTVVSKSDLIAPRTPLRRVSNSRICEMARVILGEVGCD